MSLGGLTGADGGSAGGNTPKPAMPKADASVLVSYTRSNAPKADAAKPNGNDDKLGTRAASGHGGGVDAPTEEQSRKMQEFDAVRGRPHLGQRQQGDGQQGDKRDGSFVDCAADAAKDVVVDTVKGAYDTVKDAGGTVLDQAGFDGYEGHTERTLDRGRAVVDGAKRTGEAVMSPIETTKKAYEAGKAEVAEIRSEIEHGDSCALGERVGTTVGVGATIAVPGGALVKGGKVLAKAGGKDGADGPDAKALPPDVAKRYDDLKNQGHGPQRHGADVTTQQLEDRVLKGYDPMTGSTNDGVTGGKHRKERTATRIKSAEDYVLAERNIRGSQEYRDARDVALENGDPKFRVRIPLDQALGEGYLNKVEGRTRLGSKGNPEGAKPTDLRSGDMIAAYRFKPGSEPQLITMYPVAGK